MRKLLSVSVLLINLITLQAQKGTPLLTHFTPGRELENPQENPNWAICQDENNIMFFANRKGVLTFDGSKWKTERIPIIPSSMKFIPGTGRIYLGGDNDYGYIEKNDLGQYSYISLSGNSPGIGMISKIEWYDSDIWFYGEESVSRHNIATDKLELRLIPAPGSLFTGLIVTPAQVFLNVFNKGLHLLEADSLIKIPSGYLLENVDILFSLPYSRKLVLLGLSNGNLSLFDGNRFYDYKVNDNGYLKDNSLSEGIAIGDSLYAFSTLGGGAVVIDKKARRIKAVINSQTDLPDDEIYAIGYDHSGGLWLSHQDGFTRADLSLPVENYTTIPGLKGKLTTSLWYGNELYTASSEGVFYFKREERFSNFDILVQDTSFTVAAPVIERPLQPVMNQPTRKKALSRLFGGKQAEVPEPVVARAVVKDSSSGVSRTVSTFSWKRVSKLNSVEYLFEQIGGINEKCRQLVATENGILAATTRGLFRIYNKKAESIVKDSYINFISSIGPDGKYYVGSTDGFFAIKFQGGKYVAEYPDISFRDPVYSIIKSDTNTLWIGTGNKCYRIETNNNGSRKSITPYTAGNEYPQIYWVDLVNDTVKLFLESGIFFFDKARNTFLPLQGLQIAKNEELKYSTNLLAQSWLRRGDSYSYLKPDKNLTVKETSILKIFDNIISIDVCDDFIWVIDGANRLYSIDRNSDMAINSEIDVMVRNIYSDTTSFSLSDIIVTSKGKLITFEVIAPGFVKQNTTYYQYIIDGKNAGWSEWSMNPTYTLVITEPGHYTVRVRAKDLWGNISEAETIPLTITAPFTQTSLFYFLIGLASLLFIVVFFIFREKLLQKEKKILESKVKERTAEIEAQKDQITSSIHYASRIQVAMLPAEDHFRNIFSEYFIFYRPRDIVSGDFYWIGEDEQNIYITVADCTGHGVPGAFMSTLGITTLNEIVSNGENLHSNTVLNLLRDKIKTALHQTGKEGEAADGMDMAFCILNKDTRILQYAGAYNPLFIFQQGEFREYKGDRMPIGIHYCEKDKFTNWEIEVNKGDTVYVFSDGLADQFGGPHGSKFKITNLKKLLKDIYFLPLEEQRKIVQVEFERWKGTNDQVDDVTMIGFRI
jgi:serine phosphatase RsbU (regulator of sigma subunit)